MYKRLPAIFCIVIVLFSANAIAAEFIGQKITEVPLTQATAPNHSRTNNSMHAGAPKKRIGVMVLKLTPTERKKLHAYTAHRQPTTMTAETSNKLPSTVNLGMNSVPVLDQGQHGSCVTFATTAAIDALLGRGDYISQLCTLELGSYLAKRSYMPSGWEGSWGPNVLHFLLSYGIVSKATQMTQTCGGFNEYPIDDPDTGSPLSLDDYKNMSESLQKKIDWYPLLTFAERMEWDAEDPTPAKKLLLHVKKLLAAQSTRLTLGVQLFTDHCVMGACGRYRKAYDTWAVTDAINEAATLDSDEYDGHEMVIIGYNDNAIVKDVDGKRHQGVLILRNSWGEGMGDNGNYYITYDYFMRFVSEVTVITAA